MPSTKELKHYDPPQVTRIEARDGSLLAEVFVERRTVVPIEAIPKVVKVAMLAAEDASFYQHEGLDYLGMLRALWVNLRSGSARQGGSTITQQVVKNVLLSHERTFERKARELLLARRIEQELSKDEILESLFDAHDSSDEETRHRLSRARSMLLSHDSPVQICNFGFFGIRPGLATFLE